MVKSTAKSTLQAGMAHDEMVEDILGAIARGELEVGQRIASEMQLKEQYGISVNSIKAGMEQLVERGVLRRRRGSGTFVASSEPLVTRSLVQRDSVGILRNWEFGRYHPFFTEQLNGLLAGLARHGWKTVDLVTDIRGPAPRGTEIKHLSVPPAALQLAAQSHPEMAGVVCLQGVPNVETALTAVGQSVVSTAPSSPNPCIYYDWAEEHVRLFRKALQTGGRLIGAVSELREAEIQSAWAGACRAEGLRTDEAQLQIVPCSGSSKGAQLISEAYHSTLKAVAEMPELDALVMTSDFVAQGALDALADLSPDAWQSRPLVALLNKESKVTSPLPLRVLMADGFAYGAALADLAHQQITDASMRVTRIILTCQDQTWH